MNRKEVFEALYGKEGLCNRTVEKIKELTVRKSAEIVGHSTQSVNGFKCRCEKDPQAIRLKTLFKYSKDLGVE